MTFKRDSLREKAKYLARNEASDGVTLQNLWIEGEEREGSSMNSQSWLQRKAHHLTWSRRPELAAAAAGLILQFAAVCAAPARAPQDTQQQQNVPPKTAPPAAGAAGTSGGGGSPGSGASQNIVWSVGRTSTDRLRFPVNLSVDFLVISGDKELKDVQLAGSTLQDATSFLSLDLSHLKVCAGGNCTGKFDVPANTAQPVRLEICNDFKTPGIFAGEISLRVAGKPEPQSFKLTVYSRSRRNMALGAATIGVGLALYFLVNVFLRRRVATDDALVPAYQLRDSLAILKKRVEDAAAKTQAPLSGLTGALTDLDTQLSPKSLESHLPAVIVLPWSSATSWQDTLKAYLTPIAEKTAAIVVLVNSGVQYAVGYWEKFPTQVTAALEKMDGLVLTATNSATAQTQLGPIVQALVGVVNPSKMDALAPMLDRSPSQVITRFFTLPPDTHTLQVRLVRNTLWVWWLVALIALVGGFYSVVLLNLGFGSSTDYIKCFFWGLGFSVAGTQMDQLTQTAVMANSGITIPKA
jgi:hypothetical protein